LADDARLLIRAAGAGDRAALAALELATWDGWASPAPRPDTPRDPFAERPPDAYLVAEAGDGALAGYARVGQATRLAASAHVLHLEGLGVHPDHRGRGVATALLRAVEEEAHRRGAHRLTLRVLAPNAGARRLYERAGYEVEGVLRGEFVIDGEAVDDVLMARVVGG
jgi:ribosomal protein S18 acetylase RimI-like enzyme